MADAVAWAAGLSPAGVEPDSALWLLGGCGTVGPMGRRRDGEPALAGCISLSTVKTARPFSQGL